MPVLHLHTRSITSSPLPVALIASGTICLIVATLSVCACIYRRKRNARVANNNPYPIHSKWVSPSSSRTTSPEFSSKSEIFYPVVSKASFNKEITPEVEKPSHQSFAKEHWPIVEVEKSVQQPTTKPVSGTAPPAPTPTHIPATLPRRHTRSRTVKRSPRPASVAALDRNSADRKSIGSKSRKSYETFRTAPSLYADGELSPTPTASSIHDATKTEFKLVSFPKILNNNIITRTVDVRVSNHTNYGSPVRYQTPEPKW